MHDISRGVYGFKDGYADLSDVRLHYVSTGRGRLILFLHGFPELRTAKIFQKKLDTPEQSTA